MEEINNFLKNIGLWTSLEKLSIKEESLPSIMENCMIFPDIKANPKVPSREEILNLYKECLI